MITFTHPTRGDADFVVTVRCDHGHVDRVVEHIGHWATPEPKPFGFLSWLTAFDSLQTPFGVKQDAEIRAGRTVDLGGWSGTPKGMDYGTRWRFHCIECKETVPVHGRKMDAVLEMLRGSGQTTVYLTLPPGVFRLSIPDLAARV